MSFGKEIWGVGLTAVLLALSTALPAQNDEALTLAAWQDSLTRESYVAWEVVLDELSVQSDKDEKPMLDHCRDKASNTDQLLHALPGVHTLRRGNYAAEPLLRGLSSDRYVVSVDGMRVFGGCTDKMDPVSSYVEPVNLHGLEVDFGAGTSLMGASTGGGINFSLKKPVFNPQKATAFRFITDYNSVFNGFSQAADINLSGNRVAIRLSGVHRQAQNYRDGRGEQVRYSQYEKWNYSASVHYRFREGHKLAIDFLGDDASDVGYPALPMDVAHARAKLWAVSYLFPRLGVLADPELKIYHNFIDHVMDDSRRDSVAMRMDMPGFSRTTGAFLQGQLLASERHTVNVKLEYFNAFARAEMTMFSNEPGGSPMFMLTWPDVHRNVVGVGLAHSWNAGKNWQIASGARWEYGNTHISSTLGEQQLSTFGKSGRQGRQVLLHHYHAGLTRTLGKANLVSLKIAYGERLPTVSEQFGYYLFNRADGYDYLGDPDLNKERNLHLELGHDFKTGQLALSSSVFSYWFSDYIMGVYEPGYQAMTIGALGVKTYQNTGEALMLGGEMNALWKMSESIRWMGGLKYVYGRDFQHDPLPQMPPLKVNVAGTVKLWGFDLLPEVEWAAAQHRRSTKFNERSTAAFWMVHLRIKKEFHGESLHWQLDGGVENLFDRAYREHFDVGTVLRPGRNVFARVKVGF